MTSKRPKKPSPLEKGEFTLKNELLTIRFWSQGYTTSLFDKEVKDFTLICQYPLSNFNLDILKDSAAAQLYLNINGSVYIARMSSYVANVTPEAVLLQLTLSNLRLKSAWDMEHNTPSVVYEQILSQKDFFKVGGKKLESFIKPLGLIRKEAESDQALRRRTLEYLNYKMSDQGEVFTEFDIRRLRERPDGDTYDR